MVAKRHAGFCLLLLMLPAPPPVVRGAEPGPKPPRLEIVSIARGHRESSFGDDPQRLATTDVFQAAQKSAIDLQHPEHPYVVFQYDAGRLFYLFYNDVVNVPENRYLIQRVKRTTINHSSDGERTAETAYLVEAFKTTGGRSKKPDQHFGSYSLQGSERREIIKEFDVGPGQIPGVAEGDDWPFEPGKLFHRIQPYGVETGKFDRVVFQDWVHWTIRASFDRYGNYELRCPELGIELVRSLPPASPAEAAPGVATPPDNKTEIDPASTDIVLQEGQGVLGVIVGKSRLADARRHLGEPQDVERLRSAANYHFAQQITLNIPDGEAVNTIFTRPDFGGRTDKGIRHGDPREKVHKTYGKSDRTADGTAAYDGVIFWFDEQGCVNKIVIWRNAQQVN